MKCLVCHNEFEVPRIVLTNVDVYQNSKIISSPCCGAPYRVSRVVKFNVEPVYNINRKEDDWGDKIKVYHKTTRENAIDWWNDLEWKTQLGLVGKYLSESRMPSSLTGSEIEKVWGFEVK